MARGVSPFFASAKITFLFSPLLLALCLLMVSHVGSMQPAQQQPAQQGVEGGEDEQDGKEGHDDRGTERADDSDSMIRADDTKTRRPWLRRASGTCCRAADRLGGDHQATAPSFSTARKRAASARGLRSTSASLGRRAPRPSNATGAS